MNPNLKKAVAPSDLCVRLIQRSAAQQMDRDTPEPLELVIGYYAKTGKVGADFASPVAERGRAVAVRMADRSQLVGAMHLAADMWDRAVNRRKSISWPGQPEPVTWCLDGQAEFMTLERADRLADHVHKLAEGTKMRFQPLAQSLNGSHNAAEPAQTPGLILPGH